MKIGGFQKTTLLDYPDKLSTILWTEGCNFSCPFCYNKDLVKENTDTVSEEEIFSFLEKRKNILEGVVISGGEPFLQKDLKDFLKKIKKIGYLIKIDTNGMFPERLKKLIDEKLVDYISMDVKAPKDKYNKLAGVKVDLKKIEKSIKIIKNSDIDYEFKTTFVPDLLTKEDIIKIAKWLKGSKKYYLQQFKNDADVISEDLKNVKPYPKGKIMDTLKKIKPYYGKCEVRGV